MYALIKLFAPYLLVLAIGGAAGGWLTYKVMSYRHGEALVALAAAHKKAQEDLTTKLVAECEQAKRITADEAREVSGKLDELDRRYRDLVRLRGKACVPVALPATATASADDAAGDWTQLAGPYGLAAESLYDIAYDGDRARVKLATCQSFIRKTWSAHGQQI